MINRVQDEPYMKSKLYIYSSRITTSRVVNVVERYDVELLRKLREARK
jgi:hypothetical protein